MLFNSLASDMSISCEEKLVIENLSLILDCSLISDGERKICPL